MKNNIMKTSKSWYQVFLGSLLLGIFLVACDQAPTTEGNAGSATQSNVLHILAGSELKDMADLAPEVTRNTGVELVFEYTGTLDAVEKIASGEAYDAVWVSHGKYLQMTPGARERIKLSEKTMLSPVVLGIKESKAKQLGWCNNANLTWKDIATAAEAGKFTFGMTNPTSSNSGFTALVGLTAALSDKADALTIDDVRANKTSSFFKAQRLTAGSSGWLAEAYLRDQTSVDGIINYESVLLSINQNPVATEKLCLIYPKEGIITADYPLMLLSDSKKADFEKVLGYVRSNDFQQRMMEKTLRRPVNSAVKIGAAFPNALLIELPFPGQLDVVDALLDTFLNSVRIPAHSWFVLDTSGSMGKNGGIEQLKTALAGLAGDGTVTTTDNLARFLNREQIDILTFSHELSPIVHYEMGSTESENLNTRSKIAQFAKSLNANGGTAIYSAVQRTYQAAAAAQQREGSNFYQTIVLMTDGRNTDGIGFNDFKEWYTQLPAHQQTIRVFPVVFGEADIEELGQLAKLTGGKIFDGRKGSLRQVFKEIRGYQ